MLGLGSYAAQQALERHGYRALTPSEYDWLHDHKEELRKAREEGKAEGRLEAIKEMYARRSREAA